MVFNLLSLLSLLFDTSPNFISYSFEFVSIVSNWIHAFHVDSEITTTTKDDVVTMAARLSITSKVSVVIIPPTPPVIF